ncbi:MAG: M13 family metallopeptidase [Pseudomonadota bacterium]|nr:M13 family metallopeptidase [Pseudomonadota bacterium]
MPRHHALRPLACALALSLIAGFAAPDAEAQSITTAAQTPSAPTACSNFYAFANNDWLNANMLMPGAGSVSALEQLGSRARQQQVELLNGAMQSPQGGVQTLLGDFWASGLDLAAVERDGAQPIAPLLERVAAIRRARDIAPAIAALHQVGIPVAFNFSADIDLSNLNRHIGYFSQGGLGLPDPAYYTRTDTATRNLLGQYNGYVQKILALTGTAQKDLAAEAQLVIDLETRIAMASRPLTLMRDPRNNYAAVPVAQLDTQFRQLKLVEFLKAQGVSDDSVSIAQPALFTELDNLVGGLEPAQWKAYLRWRIGDAMAPYLAKPWRDASFDFRGRVLAGQTTPPVRADMVLDAINLAAGPMIGREYAARYLPNASKARATEIATQVRTALGAAIERDTRLSATARTEAKAKLDALKIEIGTPSRDLDYTVQPMGRGSFGSNMLIASTWHHREEMKRIGQGNANRRWDVLPQHPALAYDITQNRLIVTAAMLQPPVLDLNKEASAQYGAFGALVGHELSHGFDIRGRLVDSRQQLRDWWSTGEAGAWEALGNRVAAQYGQHDYPVLTGIKLNGSQTRDENIADFVGIELAWSAYRIALPEATQESKEAFFKGWASLWPQQMSSEMATRRLATSVHSPGLWRTNGPLMNQAAFAETFDCKADAAMQLKDDERIVIWR